MVVIEHKEDLNPQIIVKDTSGKALATYSVPTGAQVAVDEGTRIDAGSIIAKTPRQASKTQILLVAFHALLNYLKHAGPRK